MKKISKVESKNLIKSVAVFIIFCAAFFSTQTAYAATITMSVTDNITTTVLPTNPSGTIATSSTNTANISIKTDSTSGYTLSLKSTSSTAPSLKLNGTDDTKKINSISEQKSTIESFTTGTWGYKPTKKNGTTWNNLTVKHGTTDYTAGYYLPGPTTTEDILDITDSANTENNEYNLAIATKVGSETAIGSYSNSFIVAAVTNAIPPYMQDVLEWQDTELPNVGDSIQTVDERDGKTYWVTRLCTAGTLASCTDSQVWMTQNLDLNLSDTTALTSEDTDLNVSGSGAYSSGYSKSGDVISYTPLRTTINATNNKTTTGTSGSISGWSNDNSAPYSVDVGNVYQTGTYFSSSTCNYLTTACDKFKNTPDTTSTTPNAEHGHVGNYYNWSAAIASNSSNSLTTQYTTAQNSICPKGWHLPMGYDGTNGDFKTLNTLYNGGSTSTDQGLFKQPLYFSRAGYVYSGRLGSSGYGGYVWSSSVFSSSSAYDLYFTSDYVTPQVSLNRLYGFSVRCVAE